LEHLSAEENMQSTSNRDLGVGLFVLLGLAVIAYLSLQVGGLSLRDSGGLVLYATFDDIGGLSPRSSVRIGGVRVGRVESIDLDEDLRARVELNLMQDLELPVDSAAAIRTSGLLGDQFVALEPGAEDDFLVSGEDFSFTESAMNLDKLIGTVVHGDGLGGGD
jgi:phospholipid/cholesterol/gamma-HCH transport system substrate-binding protein